MTIFQRSEVSHPIFFCLSWSAKMSAAGPWLPQTCATARSQLAKADTGIPKAHSLVNRLNLA
jgi:hypothetical protein